MIPSFGTDGIRGQAGIAPLTPPILHNIGHACAQAFGPHAQITLGRDTRRSGKWISEALSAGIIEGGGQLYDMGIVPTAAVSCAVVAERHTLGIMITASHNPWRDNGIKLFSSGGHKLSKAEQKILLQAMKAPTKNEIKGSYQHSPDLINHWKEALPKPDLRGFSMLVDCAHGAAAPHAPEILRSLGAQLKLRGCEPDGQNINDGVGALHPPQTTEGTDIAICFDGDADRVSFVNTYAQQIDGDDVLWLLRNHFKGPLVGTVMSNGGLEKALNGRLHRSAVGDAHVEELMTQLKSPLGAEQSGHILFAQGLPTGDGLFSALTLLSHIDLPLPKREWERWPVCKQNIRIDGARIDLKTLTSIKVAESSGQRVIVRYSGTEPLLRIMVEGPQAAQHLTSISEEFLASQK